MRSSKERSGRDTCGRCLRYLFRMRFTRWRRLWRKVSRFARPRPLRARWSIRRAGMDIGPTDRRGLHHLSREVLDNPIDEAMNGTCDRIDVWIGESNEITVADNGRGIPVGPHPTQKDPRGRPMDALEVVMTILHAGGKFGGAGYKVSGGLHGVGVSVVNALASSTVVEVHRDGKIYTQSFERGKPTSAVRTIPKPQLPTPPVLPWKESGRVTGTVTRFAPDKEMFPVIEWDA